MEDVYIVGLVKRMLRNRQSFTGNISPSSEFTTCWELQRSVAKLDEHSLCSNLLLLFELLILFASRNDPGGFI